MTDVLNDAFEHEITINQGQGKDFGAYKGMLRLAFDECHRVLKPGHHMTITFHDTDARVRGILYEAMQDAGFTFQQTVYQPPPRPSEKSLLHETGSPTGDYMITFTKPENENSKRLLKVDDEGVILKRAIDAIFSRRDEPVPFNLLLSLLDLQLAEMGYLPPDMRHPLDRFLHDDPGYSWTAKQGWFFCNAGEVTSKVQMPLHTRIDEEINRLLPRVKDMHGTARLETIANAVFSALHGVLTPGIKDLKQAIARGCLAHDRGFTTP
jgi:hypothetical protein